MVEFDNLIFHLKKESTQSSWKDSHKKMKISFSRNEKKISFNINGAKPAAVLLLLFQTTKRFAFYNKKNRKIKIS